MFFQRYATNNCFENYCGRSNGLSVRYKSKLFIFFNDCLRSLSCWMPQFLDKPNLPTFGTKFSMKLVRYCIIPVPVYALLTRRKLNFWHLLIPYKPTPKSSHYGLNYTCHCLFKFFISIFFAASLQQKFHFFFNDLTNCFF